MNLVGDRIPYIKTGFWLKIMLEIQILSHEIANSKLIDVIIYQTRIYIISNKLKTLT
nr:MAG TPA: hypothetical protein [Bacteriophage sp.]